MKIENKEVIKIEKQSVKPDLFGQLDQLNKRYEEKFLKEIHPLIKKYHDFTGNGFRFEIPNKVIIDWDGAHYWVHDGPLMGKGSFTSSSAIWWEKASHDCLGRPFGAERDGGFYLTARLCCKYEKYIKIQIEGQLLELMK